MKTKNPRMRPLSAAIAKQAGFGLTETLLVIGAVSIMSLAVYGIFFASDVTAEVKTEQNNLNQLSTAVDRSFGLTGGFSGLSLSRTQSEGLLPSAYQRSGAVRTEWGTAVDVRANQVVNPNDSFVIQYANVPADACVRLASAMAPNVYDLRVGGSSVFAAESLNPAAAASACRAGASMEFVYFSGLASGSAVATPGLTLPPAPPSVNPANPSTPTGPVAGAPSVDDATPGTPGVVSPGTPVTPPPAAPPAPPAPSTPATPQPIPGTTPGTPPPSLARCVAPAPTLGNQQVGCAAGQFGAISQQRTGTYTCPEAWDSPAFAWGNWVTTANTCQSCPTPSTASQTQWVGTSQACPSGQVGTHTWEREQRSNRSVSYNCPAGTTTLPGPTYGGWSAWADTGARRNEVNTCVSSAPRCSDGSLQVAAWHSADWQDLPPPSGSSSIMYWYPDAVVRLTPAEKARLDWAMNNVPVHRVETPAPNGMNMPPNVSESANYAEQCNALSDIGNIQYSYSYEFECVSNMGMHYCDYNWTSGGTSLAVCRQECASNLVGKSNNPYRWLWPDSGAALTPEVVCTGQPGCTPNGGYGSQQGLPACNENNVGQVISYKWYRQYYNPVRIVYHQFNVVCQGPKP